MLATTSRPARPRRFAVALLAAVLAVSLAPMPGAPGAPGAHAASSPAPAPPPSPSAEVPVGSPVHFHGDIAAGGSAGTTVAPAARMGRKHQVSGKKKRAQVRARHRARLQAQRSVAWHGGVLRYAESLPPEWDWSLRQAVTQWNSSGPHIRLVAASGPRTAQLRIRYGDIGGAAGLATVGRTKGAFVKLSSRYRSVDPDDAYYRVEVMAVLAHEIGHVLGLGHTTGRCGLMSPMLDIAGCGVWHPESEGEYRCPLMATGVVHRTATIYGGRARAASATTCLIDPLPGSMQEVTLEQGEGGYTVSWTPPTTAPPASMVYIRQWVGACDVVPAEASLEAAWLADGSWSSITETPDCVQVTPVNRYGMGPAPLLLVAVA